jgi:predicted  nucleic acid-binding Zn-ribbon protein
LDQLFEELQDVMSKCKDLQEQLTHETRQAVKEQLQAELEYWTSQVEGFREALKNFDRDEGEDDGEDEDY